MRRVLITGATGVVGSALAPRFLNEPDCEVWLLMRAESEAHLQNRLEALFAYWGDDLNDPAGARARTTAIRGDVSQPRLGIAPEIYQTLCASLTHIVHGAASVKMTMSEAEARASSVEPVRAVLALAEACRAQGQFRKLDYVSTLGVAGRMEGLVPEEALGQARGFHNTYESSKAEAEALVLQAIDQGLEATIHRPSMVVGDSRSGKIVHFQVFYYLSDFLCGRHTAGFLPRVREKHLDTVPSDYVAAAIHWASGAPEASGRILHLCSGPERSLPILDLARRVREIKAAQGQALPGLRLVSVPLFKAVYRALKLIARGRQRKQLANLGLFLDYMGEVQAFDNRRTTALLSDAGIALPEPQAYLADVLDYQAEAAR